MATGSLQTCCKLGVPTGLVSLPLEFALLCRHSGRAVGERARMRRRAEAGFGGVVRANIVSHQTVVCGLENNIC